MRESPARLVQIFTHKIERYEFIPHVLANVSCFFDSPFNVNRDQGNGLVQFFCVNTIISFVSKMYYPEVVSRPRSLGNLLSF